MPDLAEKCRACACDHLDQKMLRAGFHCLTRTDEIPHAAVFSVCSGYAFRSSLDPDVSRGRRRERSDQNPVRSSADLYNPQTKKWMPAAAMTAPRVTYTGVVLKDGRALYTDGYSAEFFQQ
jgi:hypothetical protein